MYYNISKFKKKFPPKKEKKKEIIADSSFNGKERKGELLNKLNKV